MELVHSKVHRLSLVCLGCPGSSHFCNLWHFLHYFSSCGSNSRVDVLICTPGRLVDHISSTPNFTLHHVRFLVIDEADRLLDQSYHGWLSKVLKAAYNRQCTSGITKNDRFSVHYKLISQCIIKSSLQTYRKRPLLVDFGKLIIENKILVTPIRLSKYQWTIPYQGRSTCSLTRMTTLDNLLKIIHSKHCALCIM